MLSFYKPSEFFAIRHCQRSKGTIIGLRNVSSLDRCAQFAREKKGMAFNFAKQERGYMNLFDTLKKNETSKIPKKVDLESFEQFFNCEVIECPEYGNFSSIINDTRFDYFSLYGLPRKTLPKSFYTCTLSNIFTAFKNATCLPGVGMFILDDRPQNYSNAKKMCNTLGGSLSHILSETRTNSLSAFIRKNLNETIGTEAYVGLNETIKGKFNTSADEPISCFTYRAWAPEQPA